MSETLSESKKEGIRSPAITVVGIRKSFGSVRVLDDVSMGIVAGSIHALVGENGAGKTTLMKILFGQYQPDEGYIAIDGKSVKIRSPRHALNFGLGMVHQHFMLTENLDPVENSVLGVEDRWSKPRHFPLPTRIIDRSHLFTRIKDLAETLKMPLPWDEPLSAWSVGQKQRLEILRLVLQEARILILDEPTAVLTPQEVKDFFANIRHLKEQGKTIVIVTHKLQEVMDLADNVTVLKHGRIALDCATSATNASTLATTMIGRPPAPPHPWQKRSPGTIVMDVSGLHLKGHPIDLRLHQGEIVGIAGVEGNGQDALLTGLLNPKDAKLNGLTFAGQPCHQYTAKQMRQLGLGVIPHDRQKQGLILGQTLLQNFLLGQQNDQNTQGWGLIRRKNLRSRAERALIEFDVRPANLDANAESMSGGNQQKWIVARELSRQPKLLLAAHPTRGVDIGAIESLHKHFVSARDQGLAILLFSSDLDELMTISDRLYVLFRGCFVLHLHHHEFDREKIGKAMGGLV